MKHQKTLGTWWVILILSLGGLFLSCAPKGLPPGMGPVPVVTITGIEPREADGRTEMVIEGTGPILQYTSFQLTEPLRLVVDITDADVEQFQDRIVVNKGPILDVTPSQRDNIARLEIGLAQTVDTRVVQEDGKLTIEFGKTSGVAKPVVPKEEEREPGMASLVTRIKATASRNRAKVIITGNGTMKPLTFMLEGKRQRLVVDIPGARHRVRPRVIPVRKGGLDRVRVGQHLRPDRKVRIVMDLTRQMEYTATSEGNQVIIAMTTTAGPPAEKRPPKEKAAPKEPLPPPVEEKAVRAPPEKRRVVTERREERVTTTSKYTGRRISLDLQDADLVNIIRLFAEVANLNMILAPGVKGKVTVRMVNVPWDQAMDIILKMNGLGYVREDNILRIATLGAIAKEAEAESRAKEAKKKAEDLITRIISINYATAKGIEGTIKKSLSPRGATVVDSRTNTLIVKDIARNVDEVVTLVKLLDKPIPQVMIEARIVEATTSFARDIGVQWGGTAVADAAHGNPTGFSFPNSITMTGGPTMGASFGGAGNYFVNLPAATGSGVGGAMGFTFGSVGGALNLDLVLSALESTGQGKVISTPRVTALDNKEAKIEQGQSIPYSTTSSSGTQVQFIDAQLSLAVTPHVTPDNKIFMKIKAQKNAPDPSLTVQGQPSIRKNQAETEILLADGETAVIGGILIIDKGESLDRVPFFADLPLIGWLFRKKTVRNDKRELLIFITPRIIRQEALL